MSDPLHTRLLRARVDFTRRLQPWDGFGLNYVQTCHTPDPEAEPQDYGGFDTLADADIEHILDLLFGPDGLGVGVLKMFLDPHHADEPAPGAPLRCRHDRTTGSMLRFAQGALKRVRAAGGELSILTTLYGPPGWMTRQRAFRGRDLDPARAEALVAYLVDWARHLRIQQELPLRYLSLHNEGECWRRWTDDGHDLPRGSGHDYNLYWPPEQVAAFLPRLRRALDEAGLPDIAVANGETFSWSRFSGWGYAEALAGDAAALEALGLVTSHGFYNPWPHRWQGDHYAAGFDLLKEHRPDLKAWTTSASWGKMDAQMVWDWHNQITHAKISALIPWACCQRSHLWAGGDPNPGTAIRVQGDGTWTVEPGYAFYQPMARAGRPGTTVCATSCNEGGIFLTAFSGAGSPHPDAFVLTNCTDQTWPVPIEVRGGCHAAYCARVTAADKRFADTGRFPVEAGSFLYDAPPGSVTGFYGV